MSATRYAPSQILLHWLSAIAVLVIIALPYGSDFFGSFLGGGGGVFTLHKSLGLLVMALTVIRLVLRRRCGAPDLMANEPALQRFAAKFGHFLLYALLILMPLSGLIFGKRPVNLFWVIEIPPLGLSEAVRDAAHQFHLIAQYLLFALILGHAGMALYHHHVRRDDVLRAMLPERK